MFALGLINLLNRRKERYGSKQFKGMVSIGIAKILRTYPGLFYSEIFHTLFKALKTSFRSILIRMV
jgi:hypothetical protein